MIIYQIKNLKNGKIYIGSTSNFKSRKSKHFKDLEKGKHHSFLLQRAYNKYGRNEFEMSIIRNIEYGEDVVKVEQFYIDSLKPFYNILKVVNTFSKPSPEGLERIRQARIRTINQFDLEGNFIRKWFSIAEASKELGIHGGSISWMCKGKYKQVGGFIFKYADEEFNYNPAYKRVDKETRSKNHSLGNSRKYKLKFPDGKIKIIKGLKNFCQEQGYKYNTVCSCISKRGSYKGIKFKAVRGS